MNRLADMIVRAISFILPLFAFIVLVRTVRSMFNGQIPDGDLGLYSDR